MAFITLHHMKFHAYHGCLDFEKRDGNTFLVSVKMELDTCLSEKTDKLEHTVNYQEVYDVVKREMEIPSNLIEHVGRRIHDSIQTEFPQISAIEVDLKKMSPPLGDDVMWVSVKI
ncbi:MAG: dihydroneopterin aldolase [Paludibacteraceae bacterium]